MIKVYIDTYPWQEHKFIPPDWQIYEVPQEVVEDEEWQEKDSVRILDFTADGYNPRYLVAVAPDFEELEYLKRACRPIKYVLQKEA